MKTDVDRLKEAQEWLRQAELEMESAILAASKNGLSLREIARALGIRHQSVQEYLKRRK